MDIKEQEIIGLTRAQAELLTTIQKYDYDISIKQLSKLLWRDPSCIYRMIDRIEQKNYDISSKMKDKSENRKGIKNPKLTRMEQKVLDILKEHNFDISNKEISFQLGITPQAIGAHIKQIKEKGYYEEQNKPRLTEVQKRIFNIIKEHDYYISTEEIVSISRQKENDIMSLINRMEAKGYKLKDALFFKRELTDKEKALLSQNEENDYQLTYKDVSKTVKVYPETLQRVIKKFSNSMLEDEEVQRISRFIKYKDKLGILLKVLKENDKINHNNIKCLIDELLKDGEEDKTKSIEFIIEYEKILLERGMKRVEEPLYQLLIKHKVKLTREQCLKVQDLMNEYEAKLKSEQNDKAEIKEDKKIQEGLEL